ncbi:MAG: CHASE2 domain-containing protein [Spirochaetia bacterium]
MNKGRRQKLSRLRKTLFGSVFLGILLIGFSLIYLASGFDFFERRLLDLRFSTFNQNLEVSEEIVYIDIDEISLQTLSRQIGGWPWPRGSIIAQHIIDYVMQGDPALFLFDILYTDYSPKSPDVDIPEEDLWLLESSMISPEISHAALFTVENIETSPVLPESTQYNFQIEIDDTQSTVEQRYFNYFHLPFDPLFAYANNLHTVNHQEDPDGISRTVNMFVQYNGNYYPSLTLKALQAKLGLGDLRIERRVLHGTTEEGETLRIPLTENGEYRVNFYKDLNEFTAFPADNVIASSMNQLSGEGDLLVSPEEFTGKIVVIGASATGLKDLKVTPMGKNIPGPYMHISGISNILLGQHLKPLPVWVDLIILILTILIVFIPTFLLKGKLAKNIIGIGYILVFIALSLFLFNRAGIIVNMAAPITAGLIGYFGALIYVAVSEASERNKISAAMGKYLAPSVMTEVLEKYDELIGEVGESKEITILFSDIRGFTTISETYPAETVVTILNRYLEKMISIVFTNRGTLDKMIGDAVMAFWGAPNDEPEKEYLAVKTALDMINALPEINRELASENYPELKIGIGINTAEMIIGNIGSEQRLDYTAIGDGVNTGARMEGLTKYYPGVTILASEQTYERTKEQFLYLFVDNVAVKGKAKGIKIYTPLCENQGPALEYFSKAVEKYHSANEAYRNQQFREANQLFAEVERDYAELKELSIMFRKRCAIFHKSPPKPDWEGVWKMVEK